MSSRNTPATRLRDHAQLVADQSHDFDVFEGLPKAPDAEAGRERSLAAAARHLPVTAILATVVVFEALSPKDRRRIERSGGIAMVVGVPAADWLTPVEEALSRLRSWGRIFKRSGDSKASDMRCLRCLWNCWRMPSTACLATSSTVQPAARRYLASPTVETNRWRQSAMGPATSAAMRTQKVVLMPGRVRRRA